MIEFLIRYSPLRYFVQSVWRDEAFSILTAQQPISSFAGKLTFEPPVYYTLLHFWMKAFGTSELATRSLSLLGVALAAVIVVIWAEKLFKKHWLSWLMPILFFFNPMLLYYAFEVRAYGWYIFFATAAIYAYSEKKWPMYVAAAVLGFYTHTFMILLPAVSAVHYAIFNFKTLISKKTKKNPFLLMSDPMVRASTVYFLLIAPWLALIIRQMGRLKQSWFYPVDFQLIRSVLGNMFTGYEGTPWYGWTYTAYLSLILLGFFVVALRTKKHMERNSYFGFLVFLPLVITIGISFIKPVFVNRYLIFVTIAEIILIALAIHRVRNRLIQKVLAAGVVLFVVGFNLWFPAQRPKVNIRKTVHEVNTLLAGGDLIYAQSPLVLFETLYYAEDPSRVYLYNPHQKPFPWYVGDSIFSPKYNASELPVYPSRAFLIKEDGTYSIEYQMPVTFLLAPPVSRPENHTQ